MARQRRLPAPSLTLPELLDQSSWLSLLDDEARRLVQDSTTQRAVAAGQSLSHHGDRQHAWFGMLEGLIKWSITTQDGRDITLGGQSVGSWFGEGTLIRATPRQSDLVALRDSRVAQVPATTFDTLRRTQPAFNDFLLRQVNERLHWFMGGFVARGLLDADGLVARALVGMVHPLLNPLGERHLHLSQEELAKLAGVSRQSCNTALMHFKEAGLVRSEYGGIVVLDLSGLQALAQ